MKKKTLGLLINFNSLEHHLHAQEYLFKKISESFDKFILINSSELEFILLKKAFFAWDRLPDYKLDLQKIKNYLPNNFEIFEPKDNKSFNKFVKDKDLIIISSIGRTFSEYNIYYLLKKNNIKQIQISNIANNEKEWVFINFFSKIKFLIGKRLPHKIIAFLSIINFIQKIDIRFDCNMKIVNWWKNNNLKRKLINFSSIKEIIPVNNKTFDFFKTNKIDISEDFIVLIDANLNHKESVVLRGKVDEDILKAHYENLNKFLDKLSKAYNKKVVVCIHPEYDLELTKSYFPSYEVVKYKTRENICKAFIVLFFDSTAIMDAYFLNKKIISLQANVDWASDTEKYFKDFGTVYFNINEHKNIDTNKLLIDLDNAKKNYHKFINTYIKIDNENIGVDKVIKIIKERYFN